MSKLQNLVGIGLLGLVVATGGACMAEEVDLDEAGPVAKLRLANGAQVDFYEPAPGEILVAAKGELPRDVEQLKPLELYEALADGPAPAVLREAQARADVALAARPARGPVTVEEVSAPQQGGASLAAGDFSAQYCDPGTVDFDYCWLNRTNDYALDISDVGWIHSHINCYSGQLTHSVYRKTTFGWDRVFSDTCVGAAFVSTYSTGTDDKYRIQLTGASGDGYHLSIHGDNQ